jgi:hypothetical protein
VSDELKNALFAALCEAGLKVPQGTFQVHAKQFETTSAAHPGVLSQIFIVSVTEIPAK